MTTTTPPSAVARVRQTAVATWLAERAQEKVSAMSSKIAAFLARADAQPWDSIANKKDALGKAKRAARTWQSAAGANLHMGSVHSARNHLEHAAQLEKRHSKGHALAAFLTFFEEENAEALAEMVDEVPVPLGKPIPFVADHTSEAYYAENMDEIPRQVGSWRFCYLHDHSTKRLAVVSRCVTCRHERSTPLAEYLRTNPSCFSCRSRQRQAQTTSIAVGTMFGSLTTVTLLKTQGTSLRWTCRCSCKRMAALTGAALLSGKYTECRTCRKSRQNPKEQ